MDHNPRVIEATRQIRVEHLLPAFRCHPVQCAVAADARIVHQDVNVPQLFLGFLDHLLGAFEIPHVRLIGKDCYAVPGQFRGLLLRRILILPICERDAISGHRKLFDESASDPPAAPRHECHAHFGRFLP